MGRPISEGTDSGQALQTERAEGEVGHIEWSLHCVFPQWSLVVSAGVGVLDLFVECLVSSTPLFQSEIAGSRIFSWKAEACEMRVIQLEIANPNCIGTNPC